MNGNQNINNGNNIIPNNQNTNSNNQVTLGTVSNVTYEETLGDINTAPTVSDDSKYFNNVSNDEDSNNQFINNNYNETSLNDLNVDGEYNKLQYTEAPDYANDPKVQANLNPQKKNTITISEELKVIIIIVLILFVFIFIMPFLMDFINKIRFQ